MSTSFIIENVTFSITSLKRTSFKNATLRNVSFHNTDVKHAMFDGAKMDKVTYAMLKSAEATLNDTVTILRSGHGKLSSSNYSQ